MPLKTWDTKADFDAAYEGPAPHGAGEPDTVTLHYHRARALGPGGSKTYVAQNLIRLLGWDLNTKLFLDGCGFGWLAEALSAEGPMNLLTMVQSDPSLYIQSAKNTSEESEVDAAITARGLTPGSGRGLAVKNKIWTPGARARISLVINDWDMSTNRDRNRVRNAVGPTGYDVLTEDVLTSLTDQEAIDYSADLNQLNGFSTIYHLVSILQPSQDPGYNWKTLADWKALIPADTFIGIPGFQVL